MSRTEEAIKRIKERCKLAIQENKTHFKSKHALCNFLTISGSVLTEPRKELIRSYEIGRASCRERV